jgi:hypothetical protein
MNKQIWQHDGEYWIIHRNVSEGQMSPRSCGIESDDLNKMVKVWAEWLRDNCRQIDKVFNKDGRFLFCEQIKSVEIL